MDLPVIVPVVVDLACGLIAGLINGSLMAYTRIPPFIATLGALIFGVIISGFTFLKLDAYYQVAATSRRAGKIA